MKLTRTTTLDFVMQQVLWRIACASTVAAAAGEPTKSGKPESKAPPPASTPVFGLAYAYRQARTDADRRTAVEKAIQELCSLRYSRKAAVDCQTKEGRLAVGRDRRPTRIVAYAYGYSERHVKRLRAEARSYDEAEARRNGSVRSVSILG